eukprot:TRINITY_DN11551_c0_g1_i1.p1 TRINITY_DN11551_c0_g1~~TRINITY_DN11551_c0_g1_i1.p1  ORF type:complete len:205 (-),score=16.74 TRINITY_DN11551_c0_g1_i1:245-859(-)
MASLGTFVCPLRRPVMVIAMILLSLFRLPKAQYDFPVDSCACHIHYEHWVQFQFQLSAILNELPSLLAMKDSPAHRLLNAQECSNVHDLKNILAWTLAPASGSDCAPGQISIYILCSQLFLTKGDLEGARKYLDMANYLLPLAMPCMDPAIWTLKPEDVYYNHLRMAAVSEERQLSGLTARPLHQKEIEALMWRPKPLDHQAAT